MISTKVYSSGNVPQMVLSSCILQRLCRWYIFPSDWRCTKVCSAMWTYNNLQCYNNPRRPLEGIVINFVMLLACKCCKRLCRV